MPHECTDCGRAFADGSKEMLSGCPGCGGNKFQFRPDDATKAESAETAAPDAGPADTPEPPEPAVDSPVARTVGKAATTVRDLVGSDAEPTRGAPADTSPADSAVADASTADADTPASADREDAAQASARSDVVSATDLPPAPENTALGANRADGDGEPAAGPGLEPADERRPGEHDHEDPAERPGLADLREELNEQFESIKVLEPGQYELNLMELYDREEYIIALQEDGKYTIQVPETWDD